MPAITPRRPCRQLQPDSALRLEIRRCRRREGERPGAFNPAAFTIDTSGFANAYDGTFRVELRDGGENLYSSTRPTPRSRPRDPFGEPERHHRRRPCHLHGDRHPEILARSEPSISSTPASRFLAASDVALAGGVATFQTSVFAAGSTQSARLLSGAPGYQASTVESDCHFTVLRRATKKLVSVIPNANILPLRATSVHVSPVWSLPSTSQFSLTATPTTFSPYKQRDSQRRSETLWIRRIAHIDQLDDDR